jgi:hypothetical protein
MTNEATKRVMTKAEQAHLIEETGRELREPFSGKTTEDYTQGSVAH